MNIILKDVLEGMYWKVCIKRYVLEGMWDDDSVSTVPGSEEWDARPYQESASCYRQLHPDCQCSPSQYLRTRISSHVIPILCSDWLVGVTWTKYYVLIGWLVSRGTNAVFWLVGLCHSVSILCSDWLVSVTWSQYCVQIGWFVSRGLNTMFWLVG